MQNTEKILRQINNTSLIVCSTAGLDQCQTGTWFRVTGNQKKLLLKQSLTVKPTASYQCTIFDYESIIQLQLISSNNIHKYYEYGPVKLDHKTKLLAECKSSQSPLLSVIFTLNKNQKYQGQIGFSKLFSEKLIIDIKIQNVQLDIQLEKCAFWGQYQQMFVSKSQGNNMIGISLGKQKLKFIKSLAKLKIYSHYGNYLLVEFQNQSQKLLFLSKLLGIVKLGANLMQATKQANIMKTSIQSNDFNKLFISNDFGNENLTPVSMDAAIQDFKNIVFTPKPGLVQRQHYFSAFDHFLSNNNNSEELSLKKNIENMKTNQTIKAIKEQEFQQQSQVKTKPVSRIGQQISNKPELQTKRNHNFLFETSRNKKNIKPSHQSTRQLLPFMKKCETSKSPQHINNNHYHPKLNSSLPKSNVPIMPITNSITVNPTSNFINLINHSHQNNNNNNNSNSGNIVSNNQINNLSNTDITKLVQRNIFLEQQNRHLLLENIKLKHQVQNLINLTKNRKEHIPQFLKSHKEHRKNSQQKYNNNNRNVFIDKNSNINNNNNNSINSIHANHNHNNNMKSNRSKDHSQFIQYYQLNDNKSKSKSKSKSKNKYNLNNISKQQKQSRLSRTSIDSYLLKSVQMFRQSTPNSPECGQFNFLQGSLGKFIKN